MTQPDRLSDEVLYARVIRGDEAALADLVHRYHAPLLRYLDRLMGNRMTAEDLVQEIFARLITYRGEPPAHFRTWAYTVAHNLARDQYRSAAFRREQDESFEDWDERPDALLSAESGPEETLAEVFQGQAIHRLLHELPAASREVLVLRFYHDLPLEQIATICGIPVGTAKSRLFYALKTLKALVASEQRL